MEVQGEKLSRGPRITSLTGSGGPGRLGAAVAPDTWISDFWPPDSRRMDLCCLKCRPPAPPSVGFCYCHPGTPAQVGQPHRD